MISISIGLGELIDRITILQLKVERTTDPESKKHIQGQLLRLRSIDFIDLLSDEHAEIELESLQESLLEVNTALWDAENQVRQYDSEAQEFRTAAYAILRLNDQRSRLKADIDALTGEMFREVKIYDKFVPDPE